MYLQVIPAAIQVVIAIAMLNKYLKDTGAFARVLFIAVFFLTLYSWGTLFIESLVGYPMWRLIDPANWLSTREALGLNIPALSGYF